MKLLRLAALPVLFLLLAASSTHAAGPVPVPSPPPTPEQTLLSYKWLFVNIRGAKYEFVFHQDGTLTCEGNAPGTWAMTGPASFQLNNAPGAANPEQFNLSDDLSKWVSTETVKGRHRTGYIKGPLDGPGGTQPPENLPGGGAPPAGSPTMSPADQRNQLANFYSQIPNTAAWVYAPLDVTVPADLPAILAAFKQAVAIEGLQAGQDLRKAYARAGVLVDEMSRTVVARAQYLRSQAAPGAVPPAAAVASWAIYDRGYRTSFKSPRKILDDEVHNGGGVGRATAITGSTSPMPGLPPAPASAQSADFDANPTTHSVYGSGPSFVNNRGPINVKLGVTVSSNFETPVGLTVDAYWIGGTRDSYKTVNILHKPITVGWRQGFNTELRSQFDGTGGPPGALVPGLALPYAGWAVTIHDGTKKRVGCAVSLPIFDRYVP